MGLMIFAMLSVVAGLLIEVSVVLTSIRFFFAARKADHRDMIAALLISIPLAVIAIYFGPFILACIVYAL